jgi:hypothetical protein
MLECYCRIDVGMLLTLFKMFIQHCLEDVIGPIAMHVGII